MVVAAHLQGEIREPPFLSIFGVPGMVGARCACPISGAKSRRWRDAPTFETIVLPIFYEIVKFDLFYDFIKYQMVGKNSFCSYDMRYAISLLIWR